MKGSTAETARKRPKRPWTVARTMEVLRRCPLAIAQRLVHRAIAVSTAVLDRVTKTMSVAPLLTNNLENSKQKTSNLLSPAPPPYSIKKEKDRKERIKGSWPGTCILYTRLHIYTHTASTSQQIFEELVPSVLSTLKAYMAPRQVDLSSLMIPDKRRIERERERN